MAVKKIHLSPKRIKDKVLVICEFGENSLGDNSSASKSTPFRLTEIKMNTIAAKMTKTDPI
jgi:hypothetical protein